MKHLVTMISQNSSTQKTNKLETPKNGVTGDQIIVYTESIIQSLLVYSYFVRGNFFFFFWLKCFISINNNTLEYTEEIIKEF